MFHLAEGIIEMVTIIYFQAGISREDFEAEKCSVHHCIDMVICIFDHIPSVV